MATALEIIESAMSKLGLIGPGDAVAPEDSDVCLKRLNALVDSWENDNLFAYTTTDTTFTLPANTTSRTIGDSMQIDVPRPVKILRGSFVRLDNIDYPLEPVSEPEYNAICLKSVASFVPYACFYDGGVPTGTVYFYPPAGSAVEVHLITPESAGTAASLSTNYVFPPGYQLALEYNLAIEIAPDFDQEPSPRLIATAANSKRKLKRTNSRVPQLEMDRMGRRWDGTIADYYTGS